MVVDAGDIFHGQSFATIEQGGSIAQLVAAVGFDAIAPGNHDFNYGSARLLELGRHGQHQNPGKQRGLRRFRQAFFLVITI